MEVKPDGEYRIHDTLVTVELRDGTRKELSMMQRWPIRVARPTHQRYPASVPLITGQRILDTMFTYREGRNGGDTGRLWNRKNDDAASDRQVVGCGYHYLYRVRRAGQ
mgnify:CR=1 FL=1